MSQKLSPRSQTPAGRISRISQKLSLRKQRARRENIADATEALAEESKARKVLEMYVVELEKLIDSSAEALAEEQKARQDLEMFVMQIADTVGVGPPPSSSASSTKQSTPSKPARASKCWCPNGQCK